MDLSQFTKLRPYLYHTTAQGNLERIHAEKRLRSAAALVKAAGSDLSLSERRPTSVVLTFEYGADVTLRDQRPLHAGAIEFEGGWTLPTLVEHLNGHVFFWPGTANGPIPSGVRHAHRYVQAGESLLFLRIPTKALMEATPRFSIVNSGSPRYSGGVKSKRGPETFRQAAAFLESPGRVIEVVFAGAVDLPATTEVRESLGGGWARGWQQL